MAPTATAITTATASSDASEGPVMALINKRLRALRKKLNRITQMEDSISQGKTLNKEQQEVLRTKTSVLTLMEELEKLRAPLSTAASEEMTLATTHHHQAPFEAQNKVAEASPEDEEEAKKPEDLVNLLYFGSLFDVKSLSELGAIMVMRTHERGCCLVYDTVTDESTDLLCDKDLDLISELWNKIVSRPADSFLSHKNALEHCVEHVKLWLARSDQPIASNCGVSYAGLREKLKKIMGSNYLTITPEMVAPVEAAATSGGAFPVAADNEQKVFTMDPTATATASSDAGEGPVMELINKRLRALRKKLKQIVEMEESISEGKTLNNDQQELLCSKPSIIILIEGLDNLRAPLSAAVSEDITLATNQHSQALSNAPKEEAELEDLVNLLYFGSLFDLKPQNEEFASIMLTRMTHERNRCLVYDTVADESMDLLSHKDLDLISELCTMMISRPDDSLLPHKNALERCIEHAKLWLANSNQPIASSCNVSYAGLREKLKKIMASNYFTITPEMVAPVEAAAASGGYYGASGGNYGAFPVAADNEQKETMPPAPPLRRIDKGKAKVMEPNTISSDSDVEVKSNPYEVIALWDKENADLPPGVRIEDLRDYMETSLKRHDSRLVLGQLIAYGPNLDPGLRHGITFVTLPKDNLPCQVRVSDHCLKLVVRDLAKTKVKVMRCTDIADKYIITEVCLQMLIDEKKRVLIIAGDADYRTCMAGFKNGYFMVAQPKVSSWMLHLTAKATWMWGTGDEHDMLRGGCGARPFYFTAPGYQRIMT